MATTPQTEALFRDRAGARVTTRRMFGEYAVHAGGKTVGFLCDDTFLVRQLPEATDYLHRTGHDPVAGHPYPGAKPYWRIDPDLWDDGDWLEGLIALLAEVLPAPKPKRAGKGRTGPRED